MASQIMRALTALCLVTAMGVSRGLCASELTSQGLQFVRIAVMADVPEMEVSVRGRYEMVNPLTGEALKKGRALKPSRVYGKANGIQIGEEWYPLTAVRLTPRKDITVGTNKGKRRYRGSLDILRGNNSRLLAVNTIELEQYIKGVLYHEVSNRWPMEATKAQAVAVRTYTLYQMKENKTRKYDVTSNIYSQVYGGRSAERFRTNLAVNRTRGEVMTYKGTILPAYYHASCGGHTEGAGNLWKHALPPLEGVPCPFCRTGPHYAWTKNYRSKDIQDKLNAHGYNLGPIQEISIGKRNGSGRIETIRIVSRDGLETVVPGIQFRNLIGPNSIKSNKYDVVMKGYYFDLIGKGWGHGVGLCQWGAHQMARERHPYKEILAFYYPGAVIVDYRQHPPVDLP